MKTKTPAIFCALFAAALTCSTAVAYDTPATTTRSDSTLKRSDQNFIEKAAASGMKEVAVSQAALPNLKNTQLRSFAERMVSDHTQGNSEMMALAARKGVTLPDKSDKALKLDEKWSKASDDLDEDYIETMVSDHKKAVELHEEAARSTDADIAAHAQKMLPKLRAHLEEAQQLEKLVD